MYLMFVCVCTMFLVVDFDCCTYCRVRLITTGNLCIDFYQAHVSLISTYKLSKKQERQYDECGCMTVHASRIGSEFIHDCLSV